MVKLQDVHKVYDNGTKALKGVSLTIENGEFVFVVGPSGSGKSTIIKMLIAETKPTSGKVLINGFDIGALRQREIPYLRRTVGVVFQDFRLIDNKTVYENVAFVMRAVGAPMKVVKKRVPYVLDLVGVLHKARRLPSELSGGEQQRVAIARALVNNPDIVIADEPTGNLDPARSLELMMLFEKINALGTTVVVVTHEKVLVNQFEKRVIAIDGGMVIGDRQGGYYEERYPGIYIPEDEPEQGEQTPETAEDAAPAYEDEPEETADAYEAYAFAEHEEPAEAEEPAEQEAEVDE
ncbi:MAG: cell division ATP-binding protein FtsE [Clostridia bacterium]|nr:cell division ATP-binding protein FtsE [Clostridia bacterium]